VAGEDSTVEGEEFTVAGEEDFREVAGARFAGAEASPGEAAPGSSADARSADIMEAEAITEAAAAGVAEATAGAEDIGAEDTVTDGDGDLALGGPIGDGDIRMATTARGTTRPIPIILTRTTILRTIRLGIRMLTTGTTILRRQIARRGPSPTSTDPQDPGDRRYRKAEQMQTTQTATTRRLGHAGQLSPWTG